MRIACAAWLVLCVCLCAQGYEASALSLQGEVKYKNFEHFDYVNPKAPKGGHIKQYALGSYESFYDFLLKGVSAKGLELLYDTLMVRSLDEPSSQYGLVAKRVRIAEDRSSVTFYLDANARFNDGSRITAFDVEYSFEVIARGENPAMVRYYADVERAVVVDERTIRFEFKNNKNRELVLILGDLPVFPKHVYATRDFHKNPLAIPLGSGPYRLESFDAGRSVTYKRVEDYWARNHPVRVGLFNFDKITIDYYRDDLVALEAFKAGRYDFREETSAKNWALGYAIKDVQKEELPHFLPSGMQGFVFNVRRRHFANRAVREAIGLAFDFEWSNKNLFYQQYTRTTSFFDNSIYASSGVPQGVELAILEPFRGVLLEALFTQSFSLPLSSGSGENRENLKRAQALLREAGYRAVNGVLQKDGIPLEFELLLVSPAMERVAIPFQKNLQILGITMRIRVVDLAQYVNRLRRFDYDMIVSVFPQSLSPGNEQASFWGSEAARIQGSYNYAGIENAVVDALITRVIQAENHEDLLFSVRALDRVLLWEHYVIPHFHTKIFRVAFWDFLKHPEATPPYSLGFETWWVDAEKLQALQKRFPHFRR